VKGLLEDQEQRDKGDEEEETGENRLKNYSRERIVLTDG
jgi:hypothetical protein